MVYRMNIPRSIFIKKLAGIVALLFLSIVTALGQTLDPITADNLRIDESVEGGYLLTIRKSDAMGSVLLTESTRNPLGAGPAYSYYTEQYNSINGDERRILDGEYIQSGGRFYLVDSTPEKDAQFGEAFRIFIPYVVKYGFSATRSGEVSVQHDTFINIRSFALPFANYDGAYRDNPFVIRIVQAVADDPLVGSFISLTVENLRQIAEQSNGEPLQANDGLEATRQIEQLLQKWNGQSVDLVLVLDTTRSMRNDIRQIQKELPALIANYRDTFPAMRVGLTLYRDYKDEYLVETERFDPQGEQFNRQLAAVEVAGGRDEPEAVFEALYEALTSYLWEAEVRAIILVADGPPHPRPRGAINASIVFREAAERGVPIHTIVLPR